MSWAYLPERAPGTMNGRYPCANKYQCSRTVKREATMCLRCRQAAKDGGYVNELTARGVGYREAVASWKQAGSPGGRTKKDQVTRRRVS